MLWMRTGAVHQDIRPLQIAILNLMPLKEDTELQLLRSLSNTPLQVDVTFLLVKSHESRNTSHQPPEQILCELGQRKGTPF